MIRLVVDTDVLVAGMRSPTGNSAALLVLLLRHKAKLLLSVALAIEYESVCLRAEHVLATGGNTAAIQNLLDALMDIAVPVEVHYQWRPQLSDAGDEMVLEAAVNGHADAIVTFNRRDYKNAPERFGLALWSPAQALERIAA